MEEIGNQLTPSLSRERIRQYLRESGQYERYRQIRDGASLAEETEKKFITRTHKSLIAILKKRAIDLAHEEEWALGKAFEYLYTHKKQKNRPPLERLLTVYQRRWEAEQEGEKLPLVKLGKGLGISDATVSHYLKEVGLKSMVREHDKHTTPEDKKQAIIRAFNSEMSVPDVGHFVELPHHVPLYRFRQIGERGWVKAYLRDFGRGKLNYRYASQIYEAQDLGFNKKETEELLDLRKEVVEYALENRESLEKDIIMNLKIIFPERRITKPYLQKI